MSDAGRKDMTDKVQDKVTPDSSKSTMDKAGDTITGTTDKIQRDIMPDSTKSNTQSAADKTSREKDHAEGKGESMMDKAKHMMGMDKDKH